MTELTQRAYARIAELEADGYSSREIKDYLNDGAALLAEGDTDQSLVEEMYLIITEQINNEEIARQSD